jgi:hypothetical protein
LVALAAVSRYKSRAFSIFRLPFSISLASTLGAADAPDALRHTARLYAALIYLVVLLVIVVFGIWALSRLSRRYRERLRRAGEVPTAVPDVWQMHRLPEGTEPGESEEEPGDGR